MWPEIKSRSLMPLLNDGAFDIAVQVYNDFNRCGGPILIPSTGLHTTKQRPAAEARARAARPLACAESVRVPAGSDR